VRIGEREIEQDHVEAVGVECVEGSGQAGDVRDVERRGGTLGEQHLREPRVAGIVLDEQNA
jgi:hypothetical protein